MGLQKQFQDYPEAHHTVNMIVASLNAGVQILVISHSSKEAFDNGESEIAIRQFDLPFTEFSASDPIIYAYARLKALPEFEGAIDV